MSYLSDMVYRPLSETYYFPGNFVVCLNMQEALTANKNPDLFLIRYAHESCDE